MARKLDKSLVLKRLLEQQSVYTDPAASPEARKRQAELRMDKLVGPRWRTEINRDMELVENLQEIPSSQEVAEFWEGVQMVGEEAGFGPGLDVRHDEPQDEPDPAPMCGCPSAKPNILGFVKQLLGLKVG